MLVFRVICLTALLLLVQAELKLEMVQELFRHGDRAPVMIYPTDPNPASVWPKGLGALTTIGMTEQFNRGKFLRERYMNFLNDTYLPWEIYVNSSGQDRCLMSAESRLAGLYEPVGTDRWSHNISWQPTPVHSIPTALDIQLEDAVCAKYVQLLEELYQSEEVQKVEHENRDFYSMLSNYTGYTELNISNVWKVSDTLLCEKIHGFEWPSWVTNEIYEKARALDSWQFSLLTYTVDLARLRAGPLLSQLITNIDAKVNNGSRTKFYMYSAHDTTISALLSAMKVFNDISPPYAASVLIELYSQSTETSVDWFVQVFYKNDSEADPYTMHLPGCNSTMCSLSEFMTTVAEAVPRDWYAECGNDSAKPDILIPALLASLILLAIVCCCLIVWCGPSPDYNPCRKPEHNQYRKVPSGSDAEDV